MPLMPRLLPDLPADVARDSLKHSWRSYSESLREVVLRSRGGQLLHALQQCNSRLLMLHGLSDILAPADNLRAALADLQPGTGQTTVYWLEGGHDIVFTHAAQLAGYIRQFVISTQTR
jgi:pimeloyl-ACP methyl ester carboxylesterase